MIPDNEILNELKALGSPLTDFSRAMPYALPGAYFDNLAKVLTGGVVAAESDDPVIGLSKTMPFTVPEGYFTTLHQTLPEAAVGSNVEAGLSTPFDVPDRYFALLPDTLLLAAKAADKDAHKKATIAFWPQWQKRAAQWAAAAVLIMGVWLGTYKYLHPDTADTTATHQLAKIDGDAINAYVAQHVDEYDVEALEASVVAANVDLHASISSLEEEEIRDYLSDEAGTATTEKRD